MKKLTIITVCSALIMFCFNNDSMANDKYLEVMQKSISAVYTASDIPQLQEAVNTLERIGGAEKTKWEPQYYIAFGYIMMANQEKDGAKKDSYLDLAAAAIEKAKKLAEQESEIIALEGFVFMLRVTVDPGSRGPEFAPKAMKTFAKAIALDAENPRALALMAQMQYGSAQFFGNSTAEACENIKKSLEKFSTYKSGNVIAPVWGKSMAESVSQRCR
ncbi:MAG: hypothetical protein WD824_25250 [Cyclobacteriaceae bacterium]